MEFGSFEVVYSWVFNCDIRDCFRDWTVLNLNLIGIFVVGGHTINLKGKITLYERKSTSIGVEKNEDNTKSCVL